jgi:hypothetical protein
MSKSYKNIVILNPEVSGAGGSVVQELFDHAIFKNIIERPRKGQIIEILYLYLCLKSHKFLTWGISS